MKMVIKFILYADAIIMTLISALGKNMNTGITDDRLLMFGIGGMIAVGFLGVIYAVEEIAKGANNG